MLKIQKNPTFTATVTVATAAIKGSFDVVFEALPSDELEQLDTGAPKAWKDVLARVVRSIDPEGIEIEGEPLGGTAAQLAALTRWPGVGAAMLSSYYAGLWGAAQGN